MIPTDFDPHTIQETLVLNAQGEEIARLEGHVQVNARDYDSILPISYCHIDTTTQLISKVKIEKQ